MIKKNNSLPKIGMRNIKTTVAVALCLIILYPFQNVTAVPSCFAAIICMQDSVDKTITHGLSRLLGTLIGGIVAIALVILIPGIHNKLVLNLTVIVGISITIYICNLAGDGSAVVAACFALCIVLLSYDDTARYDYAFIRIAGTALGIVIAVIVNLTLPDNRNKKNI